MNPSLYLSVVSVGVELKISREWRVLVRRVIIIGDKYVGGGQGQVG